MNTKKYIVRGGLVTSRNDHQRHHVSAREVASLYGVPHNECIFPSDAQLDSEVQQGYSNHLQTLKPRNDGKYDMAYQSTKGTSQQG
ncbi:hypothetical protein [Acinetobacter soli]|uniref:hypothetical protein n=1 Tax=Acinetobacter soli TaxID=487316 RepID=UPI00125D639C|nr:hypothetical protein [Acinetobacter soli]